MPVDICGHLYYAAKGFWQNYDTRKNRVWHKSINNHAAHNLKQRQ
jgi:hypothetical protein